ncbi:MAG: CDP-archaeol synthase, partial [Gammaproteobacteria bacterium]|nr:CDP-archaeol synthase [Gammaproteobacteria bacterium]
MPVDFHVVWRDGRVLLGPGKTWRGIAAAIVAATLVSPLLGWSPLYGGLFGALAMLGDLLSSYCKRRLGVASGDRIVGFDQLLEALLPSACFAY